MKDFYRQIPQGFLKQISIDLGINLEPLTLNIRRKKDDLRPEEESVQYDRLTIVTDYIKKYWNVGTVDNPGEFFQGTFPLAYGEFMGSGMILFTGYSNNTWLGLSGSAVHMTCTEVGEIRTGFRYPNYSLAPFIEQNLIQVLQYSPDHDDILYRTVRKDDSYNDIPVPGGIKRQTILKLVVRAASEMAKKRVYGKIDDYHRDRSYYKQYRPEHQVLLG